MSHIEKMNILVACDSFKGSLSANQVVDSLSEGLKNTPFESCILQCPLADGGEGSLMILENVLNADKIEVKTYDAISSKINAYYLWDRDSNTAYIEMAAIVGLEQVQPDLLNPLMTSTYGLGVVLKDAIDRKVKKIILFVGGSATNDMGIGAAQAMGVKFLLSENGQKHLGGGDLGKISDYNLASFHFTPEIIVATDVSNPLYGPQGASLTFGYQKGGNKSGLEEMDQAMQKLASIIHKKTNVNIQQIPGAGAAGGIAGGMVGFFNGKIISGADLIFDLLKVEEKIKLADVVITGEGKMDKQTLYGKVISKLSRLVRKYDKPLIAVCGDIKLTAVEKEQLGISDAYSLIKWTNNAPFSPQSTILHLREIGTYIANKYLGK